MSKSSVRFARWALGRCKPMPPKKPAKSVELHIGQVVEMHKAKYKIMPDGSWRRVEITPSGILSIDAVGSKAPISGAFLVVGQEHPFVGAYACPLGGIARQFQTPRVFCGFRSTDRVGVQLQQHSRGLDAGRRGTN